MRVHPRTRVAKESIFARMSRLAQETGAVNLGQGFPSEPPPAFLLEAARKALGRHDQYAPPAGHPLLREALAEEYGLSPEEIVVTSGATEALYTLLQALAGPGDEVIVLEPFFDVYLPDVALAGAEARPVRLDLEEKGFRLDLTRLQAAITPRTRVLLLNTPMNPTGLVLQEETLRAIAALARKHDFYIVSDEVYEELAFIPFRSLRAFAPERTFTVGSAGKRLEATGWRVGWILTPKGFAPALAGMRQWTSFCAPTPLQVAVAEGLKAARREGFYDLLREKYRTRRDLLHQGLRGLGFTAFLPQGTYFLMARLPQGPLDLLKAGVVAIPGEAFYLEAPPEGLFRFAFCKKEEEIERALERLSRLSREQGS
ncbi:MAG: aminotransferase [Thermus sp.]|uniref:pyridoxal phosphate-dependent aminotransferase n=1 Tax=Thermus sp. TaxID=275 RepID=UPI003318E1F9